MFTKSYIEKCRQKEIQEEIKNLLFDSRGEVFIVGDTFYHPDMDKDYKVVSSIPGTYGEHIYGEDIEAEYLAEECFLIPTFDELKAGLDAFPWNIGQEELKEGDEEELLNRIIETRVKK